MVTRFNHRDIPTLPLLDDSNVFREDDAVALFIPILPNNIQCVSFGNALVSASATMSAVGQYSTLISPFSTHSRTK
jgi:hypothetical protein